MPAPGNWQRPRSRASSSRSWWYDRVSPAVTGAAQGLGAGLVENALHGRNRAEALGDAATARTQKLADEQSAFGRQATLLGVTPQSEFEPADAFTGRVGDVMGTRADYTLGTKARPTNDPEGAVRRMGLRPGTTEFIPAPPPVKPERPPPLTFEQQKELRRIGPPRAPRAPAAGYDPLREFPKYLSEARQAAVAPHAQWSNALRAAGARLPDPRDAMMFNLLAERAAGGAEIPMDVQFGTAEARQAFDALVASRPAPIDEGAIRASAESQFERVRPGLLPKVKAGPGKRPDPLTFDNPEAYQQALDAWTAAGGR